MRGKILALLVFALSTGASCAAPIDKEKKWSPPVMKEPPAEAMYHEMNEGNLDVANGILEDKWPARGFPDAKLPSSLTWTEDPYDDAYFRFIFYSLRPLQHLLFAFTKTQDRRFLDKLTSILDSFVAYDAHREVDAEKFDNAHAAAYRAMVLTNFFFKLKVHGALSAGLEQGMRASIEKVSAFLMEEKNFEKHANHGFTEAAALLLVGHDFPDFAGADVWRRTGIERLDVMRETNVDADGVDIENSPFYHQYVLGMLSQIAHWAERYEPTIAERFLSTERSMLKYLAYVAQPDGELPMLGASQESTIQSRDPKLFGPLSSFDDEYAWAFSEGKGGRPLDRLVHLFPTSGLFVVRAGKAERRQTFVSFDAGAYRTDHSHLDALSVTVYSDGVTLCPDAGLFTYVYGPEYEYFHGTRGHNTVMVDGRDQTEGGAFAGAYGVDGTMSWATATSTAYFGVKHLRTVVALDQSLLLVTDDLSSDTEHDYTQLWHLFPKAQLSTQGVDVDVADETGAPILRMRQADSASMKLATVFGATEPMQGWVSTLYNQKEPIHALEYGRKAKSATFATLFAMGPRAKAGAPTAVREQRDVGTGDRVIGVCADGADVTVRIHREGTSDAMVTRVDGGGC